MAIIHSSPLLPEHVVDARRDLVNVFFRLIDGKVRESVNVNCNDCRSIHEQLTLNFEL